MPWIAAEGAVRKGRLKNRVAFKRKVAGVDGRGHSTLNEQWVLIGKAWSGAHFGTGDEQRASAEDGATQKASFDVQASSVTRALTVRHRLYFPIHDPDPEKWPAWDIRGIVPLGMNEGFRITAESVPA